MYSAYLSCVVVVVVQSTYIPSPPLCVLVFALRVLHSRTKPGPFGAEGITLAALSPTLLLRRGSRGEGPRDGDVEIVDEACLELVDPAVDRD